MNRAERQILRKWKAQMRVLDRGRAVTNAGKKQRARERLAKLLGLVAAYRNAGVDPLTIIPELAARIDVTDTHCRKMLREAKLTRPVNSNSHARVDGRRT